MSATANLTADQLAVFDTIPDLYLILAPDSSILTASESYLLATGKVRCEIIDKPLAKVFAVADEGYGSQLHKSFSEVLHTEKKYQVDFESAQSTDEVFLSSSGVDGPHRCSYLLNTPVFNQENALSYIIHKLVLSSQRGLLPPNPESTSQTTERSLLSAVFMQAPTAIAVYRGPLHIIEWANNAFFELLGRTPQQALNTPLFELLPELAGQGYEELLHQALKTGEPYFAKESPSKINRHGRTETVYWDFTYHPFRNEQGEVTGITAVATEVADRIEVRQILEKSEKRFRTLLNSIPQMTWTNLPDGPVDFFSQRWYEYTGLSHAQLTNPKWQSVIHPDDIDDMLATYWHSLRKGTEFTYENRILQHDGTYRWHLSRSVPMRNEEGKITLWVGTATDIHEKKTAEDTLHRVTREQKGLNEDLQAANAQVRTSNQELTNTNRRLNFINTDLDSFIYTASHDLKTPITNVQGLLHMLERHLPRGSTDSPAVQKIFTLIDRSVIRFLRTLEDMSEITRLQKQSDQPVESVNLKDVVNDIRMDLAIPIEQAGTRVEVAVDDCKLIRFSPKNLRSVVYNLLSNAVKYRDPNQQSVVKVQARTTNEHHILKVKDNGLGMDLSQDTKLFKMFQRLHSHVEGTGVGLYIVKKIVENAGGTITVESKLGSGTTFMVFFKR